MLKPTCRVYSLAKLPPIENRRNGAVLPIVAVLVVLLLGMAAFSIDMAYIELVKTQLRVATDSAAKAGATAIIQGGSLAEIQNAVKTIAAANQVAGKPLSVVNSDIVLGQSVEQLDGSWKFVAGQMPYRAVRVSSSMSNSNANGTVKLFFGPFLGTSTYSPTNTSEAAALACDVCLVLDRSQSMTWDLSGNSFSYPPPILLDQIRGLKSPPIYGSRWSGLTSAISTFCSTLQATSSPPHVAVVTWASDVTRSSYEYAVTGKTSPGVTTDLGLTTNMSSVNAAVLSHSNDVMLGATNMSAGIDRGISVLTGPGTRSYAKKIMILMTDGQWNTGSDPVTSAQTAVAEDIKIHCICFLKNADQTSTQKIASMTGGKFYFASDVASLNEIFQELAQSLPVVLTR